MKEGYYNKIKCPYCGTENLVSYDKTFEGERPLFVVDKVEFNEEMKIRDVVSLMICENRHWFYISEDCK